ARLAPPAHGGERLRLVGDARAGGGDVLVGVAGQEGETGGAPASRSASAQAPCGSSPTRHAGRADTTCGHAPRVAARSSTPPRPSPPGERAAYGGGAVGEDAGAAVGGRREPPARTEGEM